MQTIFQNQNKHYTEEKNLLEKTREKKFVKLLPSGISSSIFHLTEKVYWPSSCQCKSMFYVRTDIE
jgi:hypothetical protein